MSLYNLVMTSGRNPFYFAQTVFTVWMIADIYSRKSETFWYWIVLGFPGIGAWIYFFTVKSKDFSYSFRKFQREKKESLEVLEFRAQRTPTFANHLALGQRLLELKKFGAARESFVAAQGLEAEEPDMLFGLAECDANSGDLKGAGQILEQLIRRDPSWSDYLAWEALVEVKVKAADFEGALLTAQELARLSPNLRSEVVLAERLAHEGQHEEVRRVVEAALKEYQFDPPHLRRLNRAYARRAKAILKRVASSAIDTPRAA